MKLIVIPRLLNIYMYTTDILWFVKLIQDREGDFLQRNPVCSQVGLRWMLEREIIRPPPHPSPIPYKWLGGGGEGGIIGLTLSVSLCPSVCVSDFVWGPFWTKLGMVVYHHEVVCRAQKLVQYLQCQGYSKGLYNQNMTVSNSIISSKLLACLQLNLVSTASEVGVSYGKNGLLVKATAKVQNVSECLSGWYLLNHRTVCYQTWFVYAAS